MTVITYFQSFIFVFYVAYIWNRFGVLSSISASSYFLEGNQRYLFFFWLLSIGILNYWQGMGLFGFLMSVGFITAGLTLDHKVGKSLEDEIHTYGTILAIASGFLGLIFLFGIWEPTAIFIGGGLILFSYSRNWIFWTENLAFACMAAGLFMRAY